MPCQRLDVVIFLSKSCIMSPCLSIGTSYGAENTVCLNNRLETVTRMTSFDGTVIFFVKRCAKILLRCTKFHRESPCYSAAFPERFMGGGMGPLTGRVLVSECSFLTFLHFFQNYFVTALSSKDPGILHSLHPTVLWAAKKTTFLNIFGRGTRLKLTT